MSWIYKLMISMIIVMSLVLTGHFAINGWDKGIKPLAIIAPTPPPVIKAKKIMSLAQAKRILKKRRLAAEAQKKAEGG